MTKMQKIVEALYQAVIDNKDYLTKLDEAIGDADHGLNMARGFTAVRDEIDNITEDTSAKEALQIVGKAISDNTGGAAGPLYGIGFLKAAEVCEADDEMTPETLCKLFTAAIEGIKRRGHAERGEKTMLDVLFPIMECFQAENAAGKSVEECLAAAQTAAKEGAEYTKTIVATKGKASTFGEHSLGHIDPGAASAEILYNAFCRAVRR